MEARSTGCRSTSVSYAASASLRLSSRETVGRSSAFAAWPRKSIVSAMQPSAAISRARARYCCWLPPQPCRNSTPGTSVAGATSVPAIVSPATAISSFVSRVDMIFRHRVLHDAPDGAVRAVEIHRRALGYRCVAVVLETCGDDGGYRGIGVQTFERRDFRSARAADAPRLLENAATPCVGSVGAPPDRDVVVAARREETREVPSRRRGVHASVRNRRARRRGQRQREQRVELAARDGELRAAVDLGAVVVLGEPLRSD